MSIPIGTPMLNQQFSPGINNDPYNTPSYSPTPIDVLQAQQIFAQFAKYLNDTQLKLTANTVGPDNIMSTIALSPEAILISASKIGIAGEVTFADWMRDVNGVSTGVLDPSITTIRGGVIHTGIIYNSDNSNYLNLDATGSTSFLVSSSGVNIKANGQFTLGASAGKQLTWDGTNLSIGNNALLNTTPVGTVVSNAMGALLSANFNTTLSSVLQSGINNLMAATAAGSYTLNVQPTYIMAAANTAVFNGAGPTTAGNKLALGIDAAGIMAGYNAATTGAWVTTLLVDTAAGNLYVGNGSNAMVWNSTANTLTLGSGGTTGIVISGSGAASFAGSLSAATGTFAGSLSAATGTFTGALSAATGTFAGSLSGATGTFAGSLSAATGTFSGNITGGANINITGAARIDGALSGGWGSAALVANYGGISEYGVYAYSTGSGVAISGYALGSNGAGVSAIAGGAAGVGILAENIHGGIALQVVGASSFVSGVPNFNNVGINFAGDGHLYYFGGGTVTGTSTATFTSTNKPGANSGNAWIKVTIDSTVLYIPVWT